MVDPSRSPRRRRRYHRRRSLPSSHSSGLRRSSPRRWSRRRLRILRLPASRSNHRSSSSSSSFPLFPPLRPSKIHHRNPLHQLQLPPNPHRVAQLLSQLFSHHLRSPRPLSQPSNSPPLNLSRLHRKLNLHRIPSPFRHNSSNSQPPPLPQFVVLDSFARPALKIEPRFPGAGTDIGRGWSWSEAGGKWGRKGRDLVGLGGS